MGKNIICVIFIIFFNECQGNLRKLRFRSDLGVDDSIKNQPKNTNGDYNIEKFFTREYINQLKWMRSDYDSIERNDILSDFPQKLFKREELDSSEDQKNLTTSKEELSSSDEKVQEENPTKSLNVTVEIQSNKQENQVKPDMEDVKDKVLDTKQVKSHDSDINDVDVSSKDTENGDDNVDSSDETNAEINSNNVNNTENLNYSAINNGSNSTLTIESLNNAEISKKKQSESNLKVKVDLKSQNSKRLKTQDKEKVIKNVKSDENDNYDPVQDISNNFKREINQNLAKLLSRFDNNFLETLRYVLRSHEGDNSISSSHKGDESKNTEKKSNTKKVNNKPKKNSTKSSKATTSQIPHKVEPTTVVPSISSDLDINKTDNETELEKRIDQDILSDIYPDNKDGRSMKTVIVEDKLLESIFPTPSKTKSFKNDKIDRLDSSNNVQKIPLTNEKTFIDKEIGPKNSTSIDVSTNSQKNTKSRNVKGFETSTNSVPISKSSLNGKNIGEGQKSLTTLKKNKVETKKTHSSSTSIKYSISLNSTNKDIKVGNSLFENTTEGTISQLSAKSVTSAYKIVQNQTQTVFNICPIYATSCGDCLNFANCIYCSSSSKCYPSQGFWTDIHSSDKCHSSSVYSSKNCSYPIIFNIIIPVSIFLCILATCIIFGLLYLIRQRVGYYSYIHG